MGSEELDALQSYADGRLPADYLKLLCDFPLQPHGSNASMALLGRLADILSWNGELREGEHANDWRSDWFAIGTSPAGDSFFLDLRESSSRVYCWDHETHEVRKQAESLGAFIDAITQWDAPAELTEAQRAWQADQARRISVGLWVTAAILLVCLLIPVVIGCVMILVRSTSRIR